ncbi:MAG: P-loop NTPase [Myxococcaceae bacterium]|nr:P-loop NTPase [Myxococcaceae bacterium]
MTRRVAERIISIGGGKGGVGKSVVAANLAVAMAEEGREVVLVDADLGAANQHTLFGVEKPGPTLQSFIDHEIESLEQARVLTKVPRLTLVRGASAVVGAANISHTQKGRLLRHIEKLEAQVVVVDVGAGTAFNQLDLFDLADLKLVVLTPQLTSIQNAYAFVKGAVYRTVQAVLKQHGFEEVLASKAELAETARLEVLLQATFDCSPKVEAEVRMALQGFKARLFGNQVQDAAESTVFRAVARMLNDFLSISAPFLGFARATRALHDSVNRRRPYLLDARHDESALALRQTARVLLDEPVAVPPTAQSAVATAAA